MDETDVRNFQAGAILFNEGDPSDTVLRLVSGTVRILRDAGGQGVLLGRVQQGEFIGEMGAIENRRHVATARAETDVSVEMMTVPRFFERIANDPTAALELIQRLCARLRNADDELTRYLPVRMEPPPPELPAEPEPEAANRGVISDVSISAGTPQLRALIGDAPIPIIERPFVIGRQLELGEEWPEYEPQLVVKDAKPYLISRNHFVIEAKPGHILVRDLNSKMGTSVNGQPIGRHFARDSLELRLGQNIIVAGGEESRFRFNVTVA